MLNEMKDDERIYKNDIERRIHLDCSDYFKNPLIVYNIYSKESTKYFNLFVEFLKNNEKIESIFVEEIALSTLEVQTNKINAFHPNEINSLDKVDICIIIGGVRTLLWGNSLFADKIRPPFLTFNSQKLGYLTYYHCEQYEEILSEIFDNCKSKQTLEKRSTINCQFLNSSGEIEKEKECFSLNDIVMDRGEGSRLIHLKVYLNDEYLTKLSGDGIIFSTSTGSTGYSLSAGGTIMHYDVDCLVLNSICTHSLSFRPIAFPRKIEIKVIVSEESNDTYVKCDGLTNQVVKKNEGIKLKLSDNYIYIVLCEKFVDSPVKIWKGKLIEQLGWSRKLK